MTCCCSKAAAQNPAIKCYFNHPVNTTISSGMNADYLNGSFPDTIAAYINRANFTVDIAMYNYTSTINSNVYKIAVAANAAANRGVSIRWIHNGTSATSNSGLNLLNPLIKTFASPNYSNYIMHNKFMVIDVNSADSNDAVLQSGSYNWSDVQTSGDYNNIVIVKNRQVALAYYQEFNKMWGSSGANPDAGSAVFSSFKTASSQTQFNVNGTPVEVYFSPKDSVGKQLLASINTADYDLFFGIYTFTDNTIANLIKEKYNSGLFVRGIMDNFSLSYNAYSTLHPVLGSNLLIYSGPDLYHDKIMLIDALNPASDPTVFTGSFNWTAQAQSSNDENAIVIHDAAIANQYYQSLCKDYTVLGGTPCVAPPCPGSNTTISSNTRGNTYQWQVNTGNGFSDLINNASYDGTNTINLTIINPPSNWYGYQFKCIVNGNTSSDITLLKFTAYWNGSVNTAWENTANWNCGTLPDENTDVIINNGTHYFPVINISTVCKSIHLSKGTAVVLMNNINLLLKGN
jgi:hypothetical protein